MPSSQSFIRKGGGWRCRAKGSIRRQAVCASEDRRTPSKIRSDPSVLRPAMVLARRDDVRCTKNQMMTHLQTSPRASLFAFLQSQGLGNAIPVLIADTEKTQVSCSPPHESISYDVLTRSIWCEFYVHASLRSCLHQHYCTKQCSGKEMFLTDALLPQL